MLKEERDGLKDSVGEGREMLDAGCLEGCILGCAIGNLDGCMEGRDDGCIVCCAGSKVFCSYVKKLYRTVAACTFFKDSIKIHASQNLNYRI